MTDDIIARLEAIEAALAHQDAALADLNEVVTRQWDAIDRLTRRAEGLSRQVDDLIHERGKAEEGPEPPPPHY
jgi:SlyX protein